MNAKLLICLVLVAGLLDQTRANKECLEIASSQLEEKIAIPEMAEKIESQLRQLNSKLSDLVDKPLIDFLKDPRINEEVSSTFSPEELESGAKQCMEFIIAVNDVLEESGCKFEANLEAIFQANQAGGKYPIVNKLVGYMEACIKI